MYKFLHTPSLSYLRLFYSYRSFRHSNWLRYILGHAWNILYQLLVFKWIIFNSNLTRVSSFIGHFNTIYRYYSIGFTFWTTLQINKILRQTLYLSSWC